MYGNKSFRGIKMKKILSLISVSAILVSLLAAHPSASGFPETLDCRSAILIETSTGSVLYEKNADAPYPPASVTKIMTLLLVCEAVDSGRISFSDKVPVSENAAKMGGSQVYLKVGEDMTLEDMFKSVVIASANDCAVALAEYVAGSEAAFVVQMNEKAGALGMKNTTFENATGLDDTVKNHVCSARDIAIMSVELMKHEYIFKYTGTWMDTIRDGAFGLTNTNRLIRFYSGASGLKTGMTAKAGFCISAAAKRNGMQLIAVIMGSPTRDVRNAAASKLLDYGFANYGLYKAGASSLPPVTLTGGKNATVGISHGAFSALLPSSQLRSVSYDVEIPDKVQAPVKKGDAVGRLEFFSDGKPIGTVDIVCDEDAPRITYGVMFSKLFAKFLMSK